MRDFLRYASGAFRYSFTAANGATAFVSNMLGALALFGVILTGALTNISPEAITIAAAVITALLVLYGCFRYSRMQTPTPPENYGIHILRSDITNSGSGNGISVSEKSSARIEDNRMDLSGSGNGIQIRDSKDARSDGIVRCPDCDHSLVFGDHAARCPQCGRHYAQ